MYTLLYILLVNIICIFISVTSDPTIKKVIIKHEESPSPDITIDEYQPLQFSLIDINDNLVDNQSCNGSCTVRKKKASLTCYQQRSSDQKFQLNVAITTNITAKFNGRWNCNYQVTAESYDQNGTQTMQLGNHFRLNVTSHHTTENAEIPGKWIYIGSGIGVLVILIIIGQAMGIIHFKKKAIAAKREARMSHDDTKDENQTRYSSPPKKVEEAHAARESGIYEVLENVKGPPPPPRNNVKQSSMERIKKRPPLPPPTDEVYEAVPDNEISPAPTPLPLKKEVKPKGPNKMEIKKKPIPEPTITRHEPQETPAVSRKPLHGMGMPIPGMGHSGIGGVPNELKEALRQRQNTMSQKSSEPVPLKPVPKPTPKPMREPASLSPKPWTEQPTKKMERTWTKGSPQTNHKPWAQEAPLLTTDKQWPPRHKQEKWVPESPGQRSYADNDSWQSSLKSRGQRDAEERVDGWQESMERKRTNVTMSGMNPGRSFADKDASLQNIPKFRGRKETEDSADGWQESMERKRTVIPMNPGLPPANAPPVKLVTPWGDTLPPKPKHSQKPIQLHPLPQPPIPEPEMIPVRNQRCDSIDDDEFEVYDDLEHINLYSI